PRTTKSRPPRTSSQKTPEASTSFVSAAVTGMSTAATTSLGTSGTGSSTAGTMGSSGTVGYPHAEQPHRAEGEHDDEHGEDDRVLPLAAEQLRAKDRDQPDQEAAETGADDVADAAQNRSGEGDDAEPESEVPLDRVV